MAQNAGQRIVRWRQAKGWNARQLAEEAGVAPGTVSGLETGKRIPLKTNVDKILAALGKTDADLLRDEDTPSIKRTDPLVQGLKPEDFRIARQWKDATLEVKTNVKRMLDADERRTRAALAGFPTDELLTERRTGIDRRSHADDDRIMAADPDVTALAARLLQLPIAQRQMFADAVALFEEDAKARLTTTTSLAAPPKKP